MLEINGRIVTIDAMGCQKEIAGQIIDQEGDYVLALKGNQGTLHEDVELYFEDAVERNFEGIDYDCFKTFEKDHGRIEKREYWVVSDIDWLYNREQWKGMKSIGMVNSERTIDEETTTEIRYYISSLDADAKRFGQAVRGHCGIENKLHWVLDIAFKEDDCRVRKDNAPENLAVLRHIALNLLKQESALKRGTASKRKRAGWDNAYLENVLFKIRYDCPGQHLHIC